MRSAERIVRLNPGTHTPRLSVLVPFYKHDPSPLLCALARGTTDDVEIVLVDDGSHSATLLNDILSTAEALTCPVTIIVLGTNRGRARARNRLISEARGEYVLFLDADMIPERFDFLARWLHLIATKYPAVAFGGFTVPAHKRGAYALHAKLAQRSDCVSAAVRARNPAQFVATSNLLVRADVLAATPFDNSFTGWGWEDVEWALRASSKARIHHIDNPAMHAGLDDAATLLRKYREAGPNFARLAARHPEAVQSFRSYRAARAMRHAPRQQIARFAEWLARDPWGVSPMRARVEALKFYRAAVAAEHLA
jgi:glycosyltransferase involved in cell wall biosynthesis